MTVKELIQLLSQYRDDFIVVTRFENDFYNISNTYIKEVRKSSEGSLVHGDYYHTNWEECPDPVERVIVLEEDENGY